MKKFLPRIIFVLVLLLSFLTYWYYFNTYSEGNRSGILQKFSKKGNLFKTYEGELIMSSIASTTNVTLASEKFYFSVKEDSIAKALFGYEGKRVTLSYQEKRKHFPWNGETNYYITSIRTEGN
jgi:hypothetical protein